jgi:hypothetical protein
MEFPTADGIYEDLPFAAYAASPRLNHSRLKLMADCPEQFKLCQDGELPDDDSDSMAFGRAYHSFILTPKLFKRDFLITEKIIRKGPAWEAVIAKALALGILEEDIHWLETEEKLLGMRDKLVKHSLFPGIVAGSKRELTVFWTMSEVGCKARIDIWNDKQSLLADLKTTRDCKPSFFADEVFRRSYHTQMAWYKLGLEALGQKAKDVVLIAQRKDPGFGLWPYQLLPELLDHGLEVVSDLFARYLAAVTADSWPSYPEVIYPVGLPKWKQKNKGE